MARVPLNYRPVDPDQLFPLPRVSPNQFRLWEDNPMSARLVALLQQELQRNARQSFGGEASNFQFGKGRDDALRWVLGKIDSQRDELAEGNEGD